MVPTYKIKDGDEQSVMGAKHINMPGPGSGSNAEKPNIDKMNRQEYVKLRFQGNQNLVGRKNNVKTAMDFWKTHQQKQNEALDYDPL
jgi:hypothetical protein